MPQSLSLIHPESACVAVSSAGVEMNVGATRVPEGGAIAFSRLIPLGGTGSSQEKWLLWYWVMTARRDLGSHFPMSLPNASHSEFSSSDSSLHCPSFTRALGEWLWTKNLCLAPKNKVALSSADSIFHQQIETPPPFTAGCYVGGWSWLWCSVLGSPAWGPGFTLVRGKTPQLCYLSITLAYCLWEQGQPLSWFCFSHWSCGSFCLSLVKSLIFR